ncbi:MAG: hypothetical protein E7016_07575 [Alphaproteobacteria bacterium]|nr:hypothetical protein [Alphaproteobacteria bacterium]
MSKIEDKILGKEKSLPAQQHKKDIFSTAVVWTVSREGCGSNLINGKMAYEMLSPDGKKKALKGSKKISDKGFVFERKI